MSSAEFEQLKLEALQLTQSERAELALELITSLNGDTESVVEQARRSRDSVQTG